MDLATARHAFISGGASGLGLGIADALAARGVPVTIADIDGETLAQVVATRGNAFRGVVLDTRDREGWLRAKAEAEAAFGPVDVLVNNAGIAPDGKLAVTVSGLSALPAQYAVNLVLFEGDSTT